jgi:hypothetical protein
MDLIGTLRDLLDKKALRWLASLGTGTLSGLAFYLFGRIGLREGKIAPALFAIVVAGVAKLVTWFIGKYGPLPTIRAARARTRRQPMRPEDLSPPSVSNR